MDSITQNGVISSIKDRTVVVAKKYPVIKAGQPVKFKWKNTTLYFACCDCALVHTIVYDVAGDVLTMRTWRDVKETKRLRKKEGIILQKP